MSEQREQILNQLKDIVIGVLDGENVQVYLFGSWARHEEKASSDIDIAIHSIDDDLSPEKWLELHDKVEESTIPYHVDIVHLKKANPKLVENVKREGIVWQDF
ncbi:nucleotidyltransferase domain-containing protein [Lederbergia sp. NSJ-179]|uniref:nucleotidyltransferase family protein n=1 Tax=Lederbergia sp. NSJ-179 TaxID=2931402 RepID=UPI001FD0E1DD|nr:nucleotidyltransferase domain-containing protein [Lederbergia sp. NSJ-179]MCJ7840133.1 nucleotidyltransferase domain-containing protein [Lederbergia sp. NSJ-179]